MVGLHCAWDDKTSLRYGQKLGNLCRMMGKVVGGGDGEWDEGKAFQLGGEKGRRGG